jgi:hypothetical protein
MIDVASAMWVRTPPPRPRSTRVIGRPSRPGQVWVPGYYRWGSRRRRRSRGGWVWVPGRWVTPPRAGAVWVPPRWNRRGDGFGFVAGRWR